MRGALNVNRKLLAASIVLLLVGVWWSARRIGDVAGPTVQAEVLATRIVQERSRDRPGGPEYSNFRPEIQYRYLAVDGRTREETTLAGRWSKSIGEAERFVAEHPVGSRTTVGLTPGDHVRLRSEIGPRASTLWPSLLLIAAAVTCGLLAWTKRGDLASRTS